MTQPALDFFRKRNLLIKPEATEGVDPGLDGATDGFRLFDGSCSTEFDKVERKADKAFLGGDPFVVANRRAKIEGEFELYAPATPGAATTSDAFAGKVLLPAGMAAVKDAVAKTTRYNPISAGAPTIAAAWNHTGILTTPLGARCNISGLMMEIGQRFKGKVAIQGSYDAVAEQTMPTVVLPSKVPVIASFRNSTCVLGTLVKGGTVSTVGDPLIDLALRAKSLGLDFGNALKFKEYTGYGVNGFTDRAPTFTLKIAKTDITDDFNPWFVRDSGTLITAAFSLYEDDAKNGLFSQLGIRGQIENITPTDIDGDHGWELTGPCIPSDTGGDEFYILFGDASV